MDGGIDSFLDAHSIADKKERTNIKLGLKESIKKNRTGDINDFFKHVIQDFSKLLK